MRFLAENLKILLSDSIAFYQSNANRRPIPITTERDNKSVSSRDVISFSVSEVFATAKVKLLCSEVCAMHK